MTDCTIEVEVQNAPTLAAAVTSPTSITASVNSPTTINAAVTLVTTIAAAISSGGTLAAAVTLPTSIEAAVVAPTALTASVVDYRQMEIDFLTTMELRAEADHRMVKKLAAWTGNQAVAVTPSVTSLPHGLVLYPSFKDSGYLEFTVTAAHIGAGETVTFELMMGPYGALASEVSGNFVSPAITAGAGNFQFTFTLRVFAMSAISQCAYLARMVWQETGAVMQTKEFAHRTVTTGLFNNVANGDNGDVEVRLDCYLSSAATYNLRSYTVTQYDMRSGTP